MASRIPLLVAALLGFLVVLVARFPASWMGPLLPSVLGCSSLAGTAWNGACRDARLTLPGQPPRDLGLLRWDLEPLQLLAGRLAARLDITSPALRANTQVVATLTGRLAVSGLDLAAVAGQDGLPLLPPGWRGSIQLRDTAFALDGRRLQSLSGQGELQGLTSLAGDALGGYRVGFPVASAAALGPGHIEDMGDGPLDIDAKLVVDPALEWQIDGLISATPRAGEGLQRWIQFLGSPDPAGRRPFSLSGSMP